MEIAVKAIHAQLAELMKRQADAADVVLLHDTRQLIDHLVERIEQLENPIGPPWVVKP